MSSAATRIPHSDQTDKLVALCSKIVASRRRVARLQAMHGDDDLAYDAELRAIELAERPLIEELTTIRATTWDGHLARARALGTWSDCEFLDGVSDAALGRLVLALLRDMTSA